MKKITLLITLAFITYFVNSQTISEFSTDYNIISGIAVTPENEVYVAEYNSQKIYQLDSNGNKTLFTSVESGSFINDMDFDTNGNLFIADPNGKVLKVDDMGVVSTYAFFNGLYPSDLVINNGEVFNAVGGGSTGYIYKLTSDINYVLITQILNSKGITIDDNGDLYVANFTNHSLDLVTQTGTVTSLLTNIGNPRDVAIAPDGMVYVTTYNDAGTSNKIIKYNPTTNTASDFVTTNLDEPWQLVIDNLGNMFVTNRGTESVIKIYDDSLLPVTSDIVNIPDTNFKTELINNISINTNGDSEIQTTEANNFTGNLFLINKNITDLTGIEAFTKIKFLNCSQNQLTALDISSNVLLKTLSCNNNQLTTLDISSNTALKALDLSTNLSISSLDLTSNPEITYLNIRNIDILNLNLSFNTKLTFLDITGNDSANTIDLTNNTLLEEFQFQAVKLTELDLSSNTSLVNLLGSSTNLTKVDLRNGNNTNMTNFSILNANNLSCIFVDDKDYSDNNWTNPNPGTTNFVETEAECSSLSVNDFQIPDFKIYPNPTSKILNIDIPFKKAIIYNIQGKEIMKSKTQNINIENLLNGIYLIQFDNNKNKTFKFIKE